MQLLCYHRETDEMFDITSLASEITYTTELFKQAGQLDCLLQRDESGLFKAEYGDIINFVNGKQTFYGYVFTTGVDSNGIYRIMAYDGLRYLSNQISFLVSTLPLGGIFKQLCLECEIKNYHVEADLPTYIIPDQYTLNACAYDIIDYAMIKATYANGGNGMFFVKDVNGVLTLTSTAKTLTNVILGDNSLVTSYTYEESVDEQTYNYIKIISQEKATPKPPKPAKPPEPTPPSNIDSKVAKSISMAVFKKNITSKMLFARRVNYAAISQPEQTPTPVLPLPNNPAAETTIQQKTAITVQPSGSIDKIGMLTKVIEVSSEMTKAERETEAKNLLALYDKPTFTTRLSAIGVPELVAGSGCYIRLERLGFNMKVIIKSATHRYVSGMHTMDLEIFHQ